MQRRTLLGIGVAGSAALALLGAGAAWMHEPAWRNDTLLAGGRRVLAGVARGVLDGSLPLDVAPQAAAIEACLSRVQTAVRAMPPHTQSELADLLALLATPPSRIALAGLRSDWNVATVDELQAALQAMRQSSLLLRRQAYNALRDLTHAAYYAEPSTWRLMNYPGPRSLA